MSAEILSFETGRPAERLDDEPALVVDVEGYEGPLDLLLAFITFDVDDQRRLVVEAFGGPSGFKR